MLQCLHVVLMVHDEIRHLQVCVRIDRVTEVTIAVLAARDVLICNAKEPVLCEVLHHREQGLHRAQCGGGDLAQLGRGLEVEGAVIVNADRVKLDHDAVPNDDGRVGYLGRAIDVGLIDRHRLPPVLAVGLVDARDDGQSAGVLRRGHDPGRGLGKYCAGRLVKVFCGCMAVL